MVDRESDGERRLNKAPDDRPDPFPSDHPDLKPYTFNGRVVIGIGLVLAAAAGGTVFAMMVSQSPQISTSPEALVSSDLAAQAQSGGADREIVLTADEFGWNGTENGPTVRVTRGETIQLTVINAGTMAHNFGIAKSSPETDRIIEETSGMPLAERMRHIPYGDLSAHPCPGCEEVFHNAHIMSFIMPGEQEVVTFTADQKGEFRYFCMVRGHLWLGMNANIVVEPERGITGPEPEVVEEAE